MVCVEHFRLSPPREVSEVGQPYSRLPAMIVTVHRGDPQLNVTKQVVKAVTLCSHVCGGAFFESWLRHQLRP
jgi:hypothetical protein